MSIYSEIKEVVTTRDAAMFYGYRVSRTGMMRCPFHNDRTPSMKVDQNFICFGCQEKGDVIRFTGKLFQLTPYEAAVKLINDFHLNIKINGSGKPPPKTSGSKKSRMSRKRKQTSREELFRKTVKRMESIYIKYFFLLNEWRIRYEPVSASGQFHPLFEEAVMKTDYVEYLLDILQNGSIADKAALIIDKGREVMEIGKRIDEPGSEDAGQPRCGYG